MKKRTINDLEKEIRLLRRLAYLDALTGLYNRHGFITETQKFISEMSIPDGRVSQRQNTLIRHMSLVLVDADHFKKINDVYGHKTGDMALKLLASTIMGRVRDLDVVGRWGGEEIILALPGALEENAYTIADSIREKIEQAHIMSGKKKVKFTISAGVCVFNTSKTLNENIHDVDVALYEAKHLGRNRVVRYSEMKKT